MKRLWNYLSRKAPALGLILNGAILAFLTLLCWNAGGSPPSAITLVGVALLALGSIALLLTGLYMLFDRPFSSTKEQCLSCGYDLRASKDKCPECGAAIESKTA